MTKITLLLLILSICFAGESTPEDSPKVEASQLEQRETVSFNTIGYAGNLTAMAKLIYSYKDEKDAEDVYLQLSFSDHVDNALYGLFGLALLNSGKFDDRAKVTAQKKGTVLFGPGGCVVYSLAIGKVVELIIKDKEEMHGKR